MKLQLVALLALALIFFGCAGSGAAEKPATYGDIAGKIVVPNEKNDTGSAKMDNESAGNASAERKGNGTYAEYYRLAEKVVPKKGISLGVEWGDLGPRTVESGALNVTKFEWLMKRNRLPLTQEQMGILANGSNESIIINSNNSNFILDVFWAFGLVNENPVLEAGPAGRNMGTMPMMASTGGWPLGNGAGGELYSSEPLAPLSREQQEIVWWVADYTYRPCCDNPTAYPDCNHGMAALGIAEWMAYQNASREEIYDALLAANSYWFPQVYIEMAAYLERQNKSWENASAKELLSKEYSSASGYARLKGSARDFPEIKIPGGCGA